MTEVLIAVDFALAYSTYVHVNSGLRAFPWTTYIARSSRKVLKWYRENRART
jgi:hypothetical protein